ncbi:MAG: tetratricopeptide repeat protein [Bacteroidota bacterium]
MAKKLKKKEEIDDEVLYDEVDGGSREESVQDFISQNRNLVLGVAIGIVLLLVGIVGFRYYQNSQNEEAAEAMYQAVYYFEADSLNLALNGDGQSLGFLDIESSYSGTEAGNLSRYYLGILYHRQGDIDAAISYLESFNKGTNLLAVSAHMALGFCYEDQQNFEQAASSFEQASKVVSSNEQTTPLALMHAARNYEALGDNQRALELYQRIKEEFPTSSEGLKVEKYIGRVSS